MPYGVTEGVNWGVSNTAGGRLRFKTNSDFIAIKAMIPHFYIMRHMPIVGTAGFSVYVNGKFFRMCVPEPNLILEAGDNDFAFQGYFPFSNKEEREIEIYFPLYNGVNELFIGVQEDSSITPNPYPTKKRIVFYGSSITQGGCSSRPGNDYAALLSRKFHVDFINLGFSGSARGEQVMCDYIASLHPAVFVLDYDYNAPTIEHLQATHYNVYETFRKENPTAPVVLISKPDFENGPNGAKRRAVVYDSYVKAKKSGDKRVFFVDGATLFQTDGRDGCTVDGCHPNDLGFYRMACVVAPKLKKALKKLVYIS